MYYFPILVYPINMQLVFIQILFKVIQNILKKDFFQYGIKKKV